MYVDEEMFDCFCNMLGSFKLAHIADNKMCMENPCCCAEIST